ncbi:MAG TPA: hypothetical protein VKZ50_20725 [bacterium]|nr:hypothetical protein [bacterium]
MPRTCTVCRHPQRPSIDEALLAGQAFRDIARRCRVSKDALARHKAHVPATLAKAREARETSRADSLLASITALRERLERALEASQTAKDVASLARELRETLRLLLELEGRLRHGTQVQVAVSLVASPEWQRLLPRIVVALAPFPDAREAVLAAIEGEDTGPGPSRTLAAHGEAVAANITASAAPEP